MIYKKIINWDMNKDVMQCYNKWNNQWKDESLKTVKNI